jgi:hypothetical protein
MVGILQANLGIATLGIQHLANGLLELFDAELGVANDAMQVLELQAQEQTACLFGLFGRANHGLHDRSQSIDFGQIQSLKCLVCSSEPPMRKTVAQQAIVAISLSLSLSLSLVECRVRASDSTAHTGGILEQVHVVSLGTSVGKIWLIKRDTA